MHEERTRYLGSYEREIHHRRASPAANLDLEKTLHRHTLPGGTIYTRTISPSGNLTSAKLTSVLSDQLGSTDVLLVSAWTGSGWAEPTMERQAFNSWGERANAQTWENARNSPADPYRTSAQDYDRGYTGHEQLDDSGLIHMNGRIYDPELGRMLGADPVVQIPEFSQNLNRYSYVLNNPLNATDPSGYSWLSKKFKKIGNWFKENWRTVVTIVVAVALFVVIGPGSFMGMFSGSLFGGGWVTGAVIGGISGAFNAAIHGGGFKDILKGAAVGAIQGGITAGVLHGMEPTTFSLKEAFSMESMQHIAGHGIVGGLSSEAMGGKFQDGFLASAAAAFASNAGFLGSSPSAKDGFTQMAQKTAAAAVVGGTASALGGGKFGNGAWTAAFQHLLNSQMVDVPVFDPATGEMSYIKQAYDGPPTDPLTPFFAESLVGGAVFKGIFTGVKAGFGALMSRFAANSGGKVFWSGGTPARAAAEAFAKQTGGKTLEMTKTGRILDAITTDKTYPFLRPAWDAASKRFANGAGATTDVLQSTSRGVRLESVWATKEYPQLLKQGTQINYHPAP